MLQIKEIFLSPEQTYWENNRVLFPEDRETQCSSVNANPVAGFKKSWVDGVWFYYLLFSTKIKLRLCWNIFFTKEGSKLLVNAAYNQDIVHADLNKCVFNWLPHYNKVKRDSPLNYTLRDDMLFSLSSLFHPS